MDLSSPRPPNALKLRPSSVSLSLMSCKSFGFPKHIRASGLAERNPNLACKSPLPAPFPRLQGLSPRVSSVAALSTNHAHYTSGLLSPMSLT